MAGRHIFIATPTAGEVVRVQYLWTVVALTQLCHDRGWTYEVRTHDSADIVMARNFLANLALQEGRATDLVFLDSDMRIETEVFARMLTSGKAFSGAATPKRKIDLETYADARARGHGEEAARALAMDYNVVIRPGALDIVGGFARVDAVGFGLAVIRTALMRRMIDGGAVRLVPPGPLGDIGIAGRLADFFSLIYDDDGTYLSEDYSFCRRVGMLPDDQVWAYMGPGIGHRGSLTYEAAYMARLRAEMADKAG